MRKAVEPSSSKRRTRPVTRRFTSTACSCTTRSSRRCRKNKSARRLSATDWRLGMRMGLRRMIGSVTKFESLRARHFSGAQIGGAGAGWTFETVRHVLSLHWPVKTSRTFHMHRVAPALASLAGLVISVTAVAADADWSKVDEVLGRKGAVQAGVIHRYGLPRSDLKVTVDGVAIKPSFALGGWVA